MLSNTYRHSQYTFHSHTIIIDRLRSYKGMTEQDCDVLYAVLSAGKRTCKDRAVLRLRALCDRA